MNVHHLELFYYVARFGGITQAARGMPYGIQQPAISGQILLLEEDLGTKLFNRRPFALTPAGDELYAFIEPFFSRVQPMRDKIRGEANLRLRLASSITILRDHVPELLIELRKRFPNVRPSLREANQAFAEELLQGQEIDLAITEMAGKPAPGLRSEPLVKLPLVLLVPADCTFRTAREVWTSQTLPLIGFPESETLTRLFLDHLHKLEVHWPLTLQVSGLELIETYAAAGFGAGVGPQIPGHVYRKGVKALQLPGFPNFVVSALWQGKLPPLADHFLKLVRKRAEQLTAP